MAVRLFVLWSGLDAWRVEVATLELAPSSLVATGTQLGTEPIPYRLDYRLKTGAHFITESLDVDAAGAGWTRQLRLVRHGDGAWDGQTSQDGEAPLPPGGGDVARVEGALDCDLALSPLTNLMPIRRHHLHEQPGEADLLMAWVSVPDLGVRASEQRYEHVRRGADHSVVRFRARDSDFVADLVLDHDGIVNLYPDLARRLDGR